MLENNKLLIDKACPMCKIYAPLGCYIEWVG
jgi:hypothetical protein